MSSPSGRAPGAVPAAPPRVPGDLLLHPAALGALGRLVLNDHWLKHRFGGMVTGKLSDVAGIFLFPLLLVSLVEIGRWHRGVHRWPHRSGEVAAAAVVTAVGFAAVKVVPAAGTAYVAALGAIRWTATGLAGAPGGAGPPAFPEVQLVRDLSDLLVLPVLLLTWRLARAVGGGETSVADQPARALTSSTSP